MYQVTKRVELAGPQAGAFYGAQAYGVFGAHLLNARRRLAAVAGCNKRGRCLTTVLDLRTP
eukprot:3672513-Pyramimonas_sp.AAC.1